MQLGPLLHDPSIHSFPKLKGSSSLAEEEATAKASIADMDPTVSRCLGTLEEGKETPRYRAVGEGGSQEILKDSTCNLKQDQKPREWVAHTLAFPGPWGHTSTVGKTPELPQCPETQVAQWRGGVWQCGLRGKARLALGLTCVGGSCTLWRVDKAGKRLKRQKGQEDVRGWLLS